MTSDMYRRPLYPDDGMEYDVAMMEAETEYVEWLKTRGRKDKRIKLFAVRSTTLEQE